MCDSFSDDSELLESLKVRLAVISCFFREAAKHKLNGHYADFVEEKCNYTLKDSSHSQQSDPLANSSDNCAIPSTSTQNSTTDTNQLATNSQSTHKRRRKKPSADKKQSKNKSSNSNMTIHIDAIRVKNRPSGRKAKIEINMIKNDTLVLPLEPTAKLVIEDSQTVATVEHHASLEQLLERQWEQGSQFLMEQAQHFDVASLLSCLHELKVDNSRLEETIVSLAGRRDHLLAVNARLSLPQLNEQ